MNLKKLQSDIICKKFDCTNIVELFEEKVKNYLFIFDCS